MHNAESIARLVIGSINAPFARLCVYFSVRILFFCGWGSDEDNNRTVVPVTKPRKVLWHYYGSITKVPGTPGLSVNPSALRMSTDVLGKVLHVCLFT